MADVDGDGDLDLLSASRDDDRVVWYENTDGAGSFGGPVVISTLADGPTSVFAADLDLDGDLDALSASRYDDKVAWYENTDGAGSFGAEQTISTSADGAYDVRTADLDGDGDLDVLSASRDDGTVAWYENTDGDGSFGPAQTIDSALTARRLTPADLDGDGDTDLLKTGGSFGWFENTDGKGSFGEEQTIVEDTFNRRAVAIDLDNDGQLDALYFFFRSISWFANHGGQFKLGTTDVAQGVVSNAQIEDVLAIEVTHNGREGDSPLELASLELRLTDGEGTALTEAQALALFETIRVYQDEGSGLFDDADSLVHSTSDFSSITSNGDGVLTLLLPEDSDLALVEFGTPMTFLAAVEMTANADTQTPATFALEHRTEESSTADDADAEIQLTLEFVENFSGAKVDTALSTETCTAPFDLNLENRTVNTILVCEAGTVLSAGGGFVVVAPGDVTFRAGESIRLDEDFSAESGTFSAEIDSSLEP